MSILEGLVKAETTLNTTVDMSKETNDTHNTYHQPVYYINIDKLIIDKEAAALLATALLQRPETQPTETP